MLTQELRRYLDDYLEIEKVPDYPRAFNGLQVSGKERVEIVAVAVDACQATIDAAVEMQADLLIVHHGLFWGNTAPVVGAYYDRLAALVRGAVGVYSVHLPLDIHPEVGNNAVLARMLNLSVNGSFGKYEGYNVGLSCPVDTTIDELVNRVNTKLGTVSRVIRTGPNEVRRVGVLTGGGGSFIGAAAAAGIDTLVTGEGNHHTYFDAEESGINVIYAGHYATETVGVRALGDHLSARFGISCLFIDHPTGL